KSDGSFSISTGTGLPKQRKGHAIMNKTATPRTKDQGLAPTPSMVTVGLYLRQERDAHLRK
ncbi:MAG TPA: hypothetical protein VF515_13730, partial [Candidatus Binatia bacterium]